MQSNTTISGYVGQKPEVRTTPNGKRVCSVRVAVNDRRFGETARWFAVDQWEDAADRAAKYLVQGQYVTVEGLQDAEVYLDRNQQPQIAFRLTRAHITYGPKPLAPDPTDSPDREPATGSEQAQPAPEAQPIAA